MFDGEVTMASDAAAKPLNPKTTTFEFSGPYFGPLGIILGLPALVWAFANYGHGDGWFALPASTPTWEDVKATFSWKAVGVYVAWWSFQALLYLLVRGEEKPGTLLRNGGRLTYRFNGECRQAPERAAHPWQFTWRRRRR